MATPEAAQKPVSGRSGRSLIAPPPPKYHRMRRAIQLICFVVFCILPLFDVMRCDIPRQRFYFAGYELWISEFGILFFTLMFLLFVVVATSMIYGRLYCSYLCPQMIFSEASISLETWLRRKVNKRFYRWSAKRKNAAVRAGWLSVVGVASVFLAFIFTGYFVEPRDLFHRLLSLDIQTAGGITGAVVTLITFLDFTLVRQRFCTGICPYGYLQGILADKDTLLVHYRDDSKVCIECKKCVRVCEMGIDIRKSPYQIECIHCGECIDACVDVLSRLGKSGLIHYTWGETGTVVEGEQAPWYRKLGLRDGKRAVILLVVLFYACGLMVALSLRHEVLARISPDRMTLYETTADGSFKNHFRYRLANRSSHPAKVEFRMEGLPGGRIVMAENPVSLRGAEERQGEFDVVAGRFAGASDVNHFRFITRSLPQQTTDEFPMTFLMPPERRTKQ